MLLGYFLILITSICAPLNTQVPPPPPRVLTSQERPEQPSTSQQEVMSQQLVAPQVDINEAMARVSRGSLTETEHPESEEQDAEMNDTIEIIPEGHQDMLLILHKVFPTAPENLTELLLAQMKNLSSGHCTYNYVQLVQCMYNVRTLYVQCPLG